MQVMLLGFILLGRSLEERARIKAASDMNELLVSPTVSCIYRLVGEFSPKVLLHVRAGVTRL